LEPDRPRRTTDGGAPRRGRDGSAFLVDDDGVSVLPLNVLSHFPHHTAPWLPAPLTFGPPTRGVLPNVSDPPPLLPVLFHFSGPGTAETSLARLLEHAGIPVVEIDVAIGGAQHDLASLPVRDQHVSSLRAGRYSFVFIAVPCKSFSVSPAATRPLLRPLATLRCLYHNLLVASSARQCIAAAHASGVPWVIENPGSCSDSCSDAHWPRFADYASLWDLLASHGLAPAHRLPAGRRPLVPGVLEATFAACAFGAEIQTYTTLWAHGYNEHGASRAASAALYAPAMARSLRDGIQEYLLTASPTGSPSKADPTPANRVAGPMRPSVSSRPATHPLRVGNLVDVDITRHGTTSLLANPFKLGDSGKQEHLRPLAMATYTEWLHLRTLRASDMPTSLPVVERLSTTTGEDVIIEIETLLHRYGPQSSFHLVFGRSCQGKLCHGQELALLFECVAESTPHALFPRELKPTVPEIMVDFSILMYLSSVTKVPVYQIVSDVKDFFNQHYLAPEECFKVGLVTLDPRAVEQHADSLRSRHPALCSVAERVLEYGLLCASNIAQRTAPLLIFICRESAQYSTTAWHLQISACAFLGLRVWRKVTGDLRLLTMAIVQKHGLGQQVTVQDFRFNSGLGLVFLPEDKLRRALLELQRAIDGLLILAAYQSLLGLL
ncbi:MAG: hypothetical protein SGPRY_011846, partial [Prymnesium sp.]